MKWRIWHWALALLLACSFATPAASTAEKKATAAKKASAKKEKAPKAKVEPKAQTVKEPAVAKTNSTATANPPASTKPSAAPKTPSATSVQKKPTATSAAAKDALTPSTASTPTQTDPANDAPSPAENNAADPAIVTTLANELAATRSYRRDASREHAWKLWGVATRDPGSRTELETHARRMARLRQVLRLAKAEGKAATAERALALIDLESLRHERAMNQQLPKPAGAAP